MENDDIKEYNRILNNMVRYDNILSLPTSIKETDKYIEFKQFYLDNVKKSTFLASILPSIVFLIISLISFSLLFINDTNSNLGLELQNAGLRVSIIVFSGLFLILALILLFRRFILKIRVVSLKIGKKTGYRQLSNKKYQEILEIIDNN